MNTMPARRCSNADTSPGDKSQIMDDYRIVSVSNDRECCHISRREKIIELPSLEMSRLKCDMERLSV
jgi:hypothetical protein